MRQASLGISLSETSEVLKRMLPFIRRPKFGKHLLQIPVHDR